MGTALGTGLGIIGQVSDYNSQVTQADAQKKAAMTQMNYSFQNYEHERQDAFDAAVNEIATTNIKNAENQGTIATAINEQIGSGRTANALMRSAEGKGANVVSSIQDNYQRKSNEIDLNKESTLLSTKSYLSSIKYPSMTSLVAGIATSGVSAYNKALQAESDAVSKGLTFDWDSYLWKGKGAVQRKVTTP